MTVFDASLEWRNFREEAFLAEATDSLGDLLSNAAKRFGDALAIDLFERGQKLTFAEWDSQATQIANGLRQVGVRHGMRVGLMTGNTIEFPITWLALARMGAIMVPINPAYTTPELRHVVDVSGLEFLMLERASLAKAEVIEGLTGRLIVVDAAATDRDYWTWQSLLASDCGEFVLERPVEPSDVAVIQFTSGTTGFPKGCTQTHLFWLVCGFNLYVSKKVFSTGAILGESPFFYFDALWMLLRTLTYGAPLHQAGRMSLTKTYDRLVDTQVEMAYAPRLQDEPDERERKHNVKLFMTVGSSAGNTKDVERRCGAPTREGYGMTEIGIALFVPYKVDDKSVFGSCGYPQPFYEAKVVGDGGTEQFFDTPGELWVRGIGVMKGYWNNAQANETSFVDGWFRTGDIFEKAPAGYFRYVGRIKDMIKRSGENIAAVEVESIIALYPGIANVAVIPAPDEMKGEEVKAVIQLTVGYDEQSFDFASFREFCLLSLAKFKVPRYVAFVDQFDYTPSEKIIKSNLKAAETSSECWDYQIGKIT